MEWGNKAQVVNEHSYALHFKLISMILSVRALLNTHNRQRKGRNVKLSCHSVHSSSGFRKGGVEKGIISSLICTQKVIVHGENHLLLELQKCPTPLKTKMLSLE